MISIHASSTGPRGFIVALGLIGLLGLPIPTAIATDCPTELPGWPIKHEGSLTRFNSFVIADIDGSGSPGSETITTTADKLHIWTASGMILCNAILPNVINGVPSLGDFDEDGALETVVAAGNTLHVLDHSCQDVMVNTGIYTLRPLAIADVNGDAYLNIVELESVSSIIHVFNREGEHLPGWPVQLLTPTPPGRIHSSCLAVSDLDGDSTAEIVVQQKDSGTLAAPIIFALNHDGTTRWTFQVPVDYETFHFNTSTDNLWFNDLVLGDVDLDGYLETIYFRDGWRTAGGNNSQVFVLDHLGAVQAEWEIPVSTAVFTHVALTQLALGDLDGDGDLEITIAGLVDLTSPLEGLIFAWHHDGEALDGFPVSTPPGDVAAAPMLADIDGDGRQDIVSSLHTIRNNYYNQIYAWNDAGVLLPCWPDSLIRQYPETTIVLPPFAQTALGDLDLNGTLDLVAPIGSGEAHARDLQVPADSPPPAWPCFRHDPRRTGAYGPGTGNTGVVTYNNHPGQPGGNLRLRIWPNPTRGPVHLQFVNPTGGSAEFRIYDPSGRLVDTFHRRLVPGSTAVQWRGRTSVDGSLPSGIYFAQVQSPAGNILSGRFLLLTAP